MGGLLPDLAGPRGAAAPATAPEAAHDDEQRPSGRRATCTSTPSPATGRRRVDDDPRARRARHRPRRHRHHRPRADRCRASPPGRWPRDRGLRVEVVVGEEVTTLGGHLLALFIDRADPARTARCAPRSPRSTTRAAWPSRPIRWCPTRCAPRAGSCAGCSTTPIRRSARRASRRSTRRRSAGRGTRRVVRLRRRARPGPRRQQRRARPRRDRQRLDHVPGPRRPPTCARRSTARTTEHGGTFHPTVGQLGTFGQQLRKRGRDARDELRRPAPPRRHRPRPRLPGRPPAAAALRAGRRAGRRPDEARPMKIGLVCPYIYPESGRRRPARPLPLREPPPARPRRPDHHRQPRPAARVGGRHPPHRRRLQRCRPTARSARSRSRRATSARSATLLERERFDLLHFHEPFVPFLSLVPAARVAQRQRRDVPRLRRLLAVVRVRQPGDGRLRARGSTAGSRSAPPPATSSTASSRATTRSSPTASTSPRFAGAVPIARWQDGTPNVLFVGRLEPRKGLLDLLKAYRILRKTGSGNRLLVVGSGPQEREARRYVATRGLQGVEFLGPRLATPRRPSSSGPPTSSSRRRPAASRSGSCCSRRWPPGAPIVASDIHGYKGVVRRGREGLLVPAARAQGAGRGDRPAARRPGAAGRDGRGRAARAPRRSAGRGSPPRSRTTTAS